MLRNRPAHNPARCSVRAATLSAGGSRWCIAGSARPNPSTWHALRLRQSDRSAHCPVCRCVCTLWEIVRTTNQRRLSRQLRLPMSAAAAVAPGRTRTLGALSRARRGVASLCWPACTAPTKGAMRSGVDMRLLSWLTHFPAGVRRGSRLGFVGSRVLSSGQGAVIARRVGSVSTLRACASVARASRSRNTKPRAARGMI